MQDPIVFEHYLNDPTSEEAIAECKRVADIMRDYGALAIRDPRVTFDDNGRFLDLVEKYFEQDTETKMKDARPDIHFQRGCTPEGQEEPRCTRDPDCIELIKNQPEDHRAIQPTSADVKWRYFHSMGEVKSNDFPSLNVNNVVPDGFEDVWNDTMDAWGSKLLQAAYTLSEMLAVGLGLDKDIFTSKMENAPHLLAPTASNLEKYGGENQILAGFHRDLNFITFHGKSRYSGLNIWLRDGTRLRVSIPDGCILAQAGMEVEHLTGGYIKAGYHEVIVNDRTVGQIEAAKNDDSKSLWRISSTLFSHINSDVLLSVVGPGTEEEIDERKKEYPDKQAGQHVADVLDAIKLLAD